jgi:hypothetical protein
MKVIYERRIESINMIQIGNGIYEEYGFIICYPVGIAAREPLGLKSAEDKLPVKEENKREKLF